MPAPANPRLPGGSRPGWRSPATVWIGSSGNPGGRRLLRPREPLHPWTDRTAALGDRWRFFRGAVRRGYGGLSRCAEESFLLAGDQTELAVPLSLPPRASTRLTRDPDHPHALRDHLEFPGKGPPPHFGTSLRFAAVLPLEDRCRGEKIPIPSGRSRSFIILIPFPK